MIHKGHKIEGAKVLIMGVTFKENCPDIRNSRVIDVVTELKEFGCQVDVYDPWANSKEVKDEYGVDLVDTLKVYTAIILAVAHSEFITFNFSDKLIVDGVIFDVKGILDRSIVDGRL